MSRPVFRSSRISRNRRDDAFARAVIGEAERRRRADEQRLLAPCEHAECVGGDERFMQ
jgi:hypothetical protein